ncbi:NADH-quinone oxidoreductase subunit A [Buchnera aphidicola]|uniref:NADH-quinone oxidoreductase subunit A n=1 Tax=Buchnera aphidicola TaxID=9 RepID=UPI0031F32A67
MLSQSYNFLIFIIFSFSICGIMLLGGWLLGGRTISRNKHTPFESGIVPYGDTNLRFFIKFYLVSVFFVVFDVEILYLYAWAINLKSLGWIGFFEILIFIFILLLSLMYLIKNRVLSESAKVYNKYMHS